MGDGRASQTDHRAYTILPMNSMPATLDAVWMSFTVQPWSLLPRSKRVIILTLFRDFIPIERKVFRNPERLVANGPMRPVTLDFYNASVYPKDADLITWFRCGILPQPKNRMQ